MNHRIYKSFGVFLIASTFVIIAFALFFQITDTGALTRGYGQIDYFGDIAVEGGLFSCVVLILGFFPGLFFYRFGKEARNLSKLVKSALILQVFSGIVMLIVGSIIFFSCVNGCDGLGEGMFFLLFGIPALAVYCIGILLLIIYKFKTKNFRLKSPEKTALWVLVLVIIFTGTLYGMALYEEYSRTVERCDSKQNIKDKDVCHYFLSRKRPDLATCEKISDADSDSIWWRNQCYIKKAQHFKDPSFCEKVVESETWKENCLEASR